MNKKPKDKKNPPRANGERCSDLGRKLQAISDEYVAKGGRLFSREEILREIAERRGGA
jgi:hypothetical protein